MQIITLTIISIILIILIISITLLILNQAKTNLSQVIQTK